MSDVKLSVSSTGGIKKIYVTHSALSSFSSSHPCFPHLSSFCFLPLLPTLLSLFCLLTLLGADSISFQIWLSPLKLFVNWLKEMFYYHLFSENPELTVSYTEQ